MFITSNLALILDFFVREDGHFQQLYERNIKAK